MLKVTLLMAAYDDFAWFYQRYWNDDFHHAAFPILDRIWLPRVPEHGAILDVCCGTGHLAAILAGRGYKVTGVDASEAMIALATAHAPALRFHVSEAAKFRTRARFDAAVSTFDSLNHVLDLEELTETFRAVARTLKPGGTFAFDILLEAAYRTNWAENFSIVGEDHALILSGSGFDRATGLAHCKITMFRRTARGAWTRSDTEVRERCYSSDEIDGALRAAGFRNTACYDAHDFGMSGQLGQGRVFYVTEVE